MGGTLSNADLVPWFSYTTPFLFAAGLVLVNLLLVWFRFPETLKNPNQEAKFSLVSGLKNVGRAFGNPQLRSIFIVVFLISFGFTFFTEFIQPFLIDSYGYDEFDIGLLFGYVGIWIVLTQAVFLRFATQRFQPRGLVMFFLPVLGATFLAILLPKVGLGQYIVFPFIAIAYGMVGPNVTSMISNSVSEKIQGEVLGIQQSVNSLALLITPLIGGYVLNWGVKYPILIAAGAMGLAWIAFVVRFARKPVTPPHSEETDSED